MFYSDFILSQNPWSYCKFDTPPGSSIFLDYTGQSHHAMPYNENEVITSNSTSGATLIESHCSIFSEFDPSHQSGQLGLQFNIPILRRGVIVYKPREQIDSPIKVDSLWFDIVLSHSNATFDTDFGKDTFDSLSIQTGENSNLFITNNITEEDINAFAISGESLNTKIDSGYLFKKYQLQFLLGPIQVYTVTQCFFDFDGEQHQQILSLNFYHNNQELFTIILKERKKVEGVFQISVINNPRKISFGIEPDDEIFKSFLSYDGGAIAETELENDPEIQQNYRNVKIVSSFKIDSFSILFNKNFPSLSWLESSWIALETPLEHKCLETSPICFKRDNINSPVIENYLNNYNHFFDTILKWGTNQTPVNSFQISTLNHLTYILPIDEFLPVLNENEIEVDDTIQLNLNCNELFFGTWRIIEIFNNSIVIQPSSSCHFDISIKSKTNIDHVVSLVTATSQPITIELTKMSNFRKDDLVSLTTYYDTPKNLTWKVINITIDSIIVEFESESVIFSYPGQELVIKKSPIGGYNSWTKEWNDHQSHWYGQTHSTVKHFCISDFYKNYATVQQCNDDLSRFSDSGVFTKVIKSIHLKDKSCYFYCIGDGYRFYLFVNSKEKTLSKAQVFMFGEVDTLPPSNNYTYYLLAYNDYKLDYNYRENIAFSFSKRTIISTGHLLCYSEGSDRKTEGLSKINGHEYQIIDDGGFCLYPDTFNSLSLMSLSGYEGQIIQILLAEG